MVDTVRGVLRVRKWPRKRGKITNATNLFWMDWFRQANLLAKYVDAASARRAIEMTKGTPQYPRDVLLAAMRGRLYSWADETGHRWYSMAAIGDVTNSLDILAQNVGDVLVRAKDRWRAAVAGSVGDVLTFQGSAAAPKWLPRTPTVVQEEIPGSPIVADNTANQYDIDVSAYLAVEISLVAITFNVADILQVRFSTDGGTTFRAGAADYYRAELNSTTEASTLANQILIGDVIATGAHSGIGLLGMIKSPRSSLTFDGSSSAISVIRRSGFNVFAGPITDIRIMSTGGQNLTAGTITLIGTKP